jgi:transcriptional repressor NrdR
VYCPYCRNPDSRVIDSRTADDGAAIRRRRSCPECGRRFTTQETVILMVGKRSGATEPFNRDKIVNGVRRACQGRPVSEDQLAILAQRVEDTIRSRGLGEVPSNEVGLAILGPLRALDEVAYLRFASVYRGFASVEDFESEIAALRAQREERRKGSGGRMAGQNGQHGKHDADRADRTGDAGRPVAWQAARGDATSPEG